VFAVVTELFIKLKKFGKVFSAKTVYGQEESIDY